MSFLLSNFKELSFDGLIAVNGGCNQKIPNPIAYGTPTKGNTSGISGIGYSGGSGTCSGCPIYSPTDVINAAPIGEVSSTSPQIPTYIPSQLTTTSAIENVLKKVNRIIEDINLKKAMIINNLLIQ